jgi:P27 family predicted phage terminase small subunit
MAPTALADVPLAPAYLTDRAKEEWYTTCSELASLKMLHKVDLSLLAAYCNEISIYWESEELLRQRGRIITVKNPDGSTKYIQQAPHVSIARNALKMALSLATQFGFTPSARTRISPSKQGGKEEDPWQDL